MKQIILISCFLLMLFSCSKKDLVDDIPVTNKWQCEIDGVLYSGNVDTSFVETSPGNPARSIVYATGSAADGKANIAFRIQVGGGLAPSVIQSNSFISYDTLSEDNLASYSFTTIDFLVEIFSTQKFSGTFTGKVRKADGSFATVTNGKISFETGRTTASAQMADFTLQNQYIEKSHVFGPVRSATFQYNTLVLDGLAFQTQSTYQLQIRTGASIKTGTYKSTLGEVGFQTYLPSIVTHYVSDSLGDLVVNITNVNGNIVSGNFSGNIIRQDGIFAAAQLTKGYFRCRVKNYDPGVDSVNQWRFDADNRGQFPFFTAGGNVTNASIRQSIYGYTLSVNGYSDKGKSKFHLNITANNPIVPGLYPLSVFSIDSCYFSKPSIPFCNYYNTQSNFYVRIDAINAQEVTGGFYGGFLQGAQLYGSGWVLQCRKGYFKAKF